MKSKTQRRIIAIENGSLGGKATWDPKKVSLEKRTLRLDRMIFGNQMRTHPYNARLRVIKKYGKDRGQELIKQWIDDKRQKTLDKT